MKELGKTKIKSLILFLGSLLMTSCSQNQNTDSEGLCVLSVYQSFLLKDGSYGNSKFNFDVLVECGTVYDRPSNFNSLLRDRFKREYEPLGDGAYFIELFWTDEALTKNLPYPYTFVCDMKLYYRCTG